MARSTEQEERASEAVECFLCLNDPDADARTRARWTAWLSENKENSAAYHAVRDAWNLRVPRDVWPTHEEILADTYDGDRPLPKKNRATGGRSRTTVALSAVAATLLIVIASIAFLNSQHQPQAVVQLYETGRGEQRTIALPDGTSIALGPVSRLTLTTGTARAASLESGEALFTVVHDTARPFELTANRGKIVDIGTVFGVTLRGDAATVTVVEGEVRVAASGGAPVDVSRDQQTTFAASAGPVRPVDGRGETDWARGRLVYVDRPLSEIVADLNRYTTLNIKIVDPVVGGLHYTGTIETDAIDHWAAALTRLFPINLYRSGSDLLLKSAVTKQ